MECEPAASALVLQVAVRVFPEPPRATLEQPEMELPPSVKFTVPVGAEPVTLAVNATLAPKFEGFAELLRVVVVAAPPDVVTFTLRALALAELTVMLTP